jgi:hypothetical protein
MPRSDQKPDLIEILATEPTEDTDELSPEETTAAEAADHRIDVLNQYTNRAISASKAAKELGITIYQLHQLYGE